MKHGCLTILIVAGLCALSFGNSWSIGPHYLRLNNAEPGGSSDNFGINASYDWDLKETTTFGIEVLGSWASDAEIYGFGINLKYDLYNHEKCGVYAGPYIDYLYATGLQESAFGVGKNEEGFMWGPLVGMDWDISEGKSLFAEYRYGFFDGGGIRRAFDEANMFMFGLKMKL